MKVIFLYLLIFIIGLILVGSYLLSNNVPYWVNQNSLSISCAIIGGFGGIVYCLRGKYLNYSIRGQWDNKWAPWYLIRPIISIVSGWSSLLFLKAGLLILEAQTDKSSSHFGFYALAFISCLNVDKYLLKIEEIAQATWGIEKSRASKENN